MEVDEALEAQKALDKLDSEAPPKINPIIPQFFGENPLLDQNSTQFNQDFYDDFASIYTSKMDSLTSFGTRNVTDAQVQKALKVSLSEAKNLNPELFKSSRSARPGAPAGRPAAGEGKDLSDFKIDNKDDLRNQNAATEMYEMLKAKDPEVAENFKKNLLKGDG
jgi:hypothetical protein